MNEQNHSSEGNFPQECLPWRSLGYAIDQEGNDFKIFEFCNIGRRIGLASYTLDEKMPPEPVELGEIEFDATGVVLTPGGFLICGESTCCFVQRDDNGIYRLMGEPDYFREERERMEREFAEQQSRNREEQRKETALSGDLFFMAIDRQVL